MPDKKQLSILIVLAALFALASCDRGQKQIIGKWKLNGSSGEVVWEFFDNGSLSAAGRSGRYSFGAGKRIKVQTPTATFVNQVKLEGDRMIWHAPDGSKQEFTRVK